VKDLNVTKGNMDASTGGHTLAISSTGTLKMDGGVLNAATEILTLAEA